MESTSRRVTVTRLEQLFAPPSTTLLSSSISYILPQLSVRRTNDLKHAHILYQTILHALQPFLSTCCIALPNSFRTTIRLRLAPHCSRHPRYDDDHFFLGKRS